MKNTSGIVILAVLLVAIIGFMAVREIATQTTKVSSQEDKETIVTIHKSPSCGCCGVFASYLKREGYKVDVHNVSDIESVKRELGVPQELGSCHTTEIDGYVVEGHVPKEAIQKLLAERPDIKGIGMAGMPSGSPGMPGPKTEDLVIYEITHEGVRGGIFMTM